MPEDVLLLFTVIIASFIPGYLLFCCFFSDKDHDPAEVAAWSFGLSLPLIALIHFLNFWAGAGNSAGNAVFYLCLCLSLGFWIRIKRKRLLLFFSFPLAAFLFLNVYLLLLTMLLPNYFLAFNVDWLLYFPNVLFYLGQADISGFQEGYAMEYLVRRTPFFSLINSFFLSFTGARYDYYQIVSGFLNSLLFWSTYLIAKAFFGGRTGRFCILFFPFVPILGINIQFPVPKALVYFYVLSALSVYIGLRRKEEVPAGANERRLFALFAAAAFMVHPSALFYLIWAAADQLWLKFRRNKPLATRLLLNVLTAFIALASVWYIWALMKLGPARVLTPTYTISENILPPVQYLVTRITMSLSIVFFPVIDQFWQMAQAGFQGVPQDMAVFITGNMILRAYMETFLSGFTWTGALFFIIAWVRYKQKLPAGFRELFFLIFLGALTCVGACFLVDHKAQAFNLTGPLAVMIYVFLCAGAASFPRGIKILMLGFCLLEYSAIRLLMFYLARLPEKMGYQTLGSHLFHLFERLPHAHPQITAHLITAAVLAGLGYVYWSLCAKDRAPEEA